MLVPLPPAGCQRRLHASSHEVFPLLLLLLKKLLPAIPLPLRCLPSLFGRSNADLPLLVPRAKQLSVPQLCLRSRWRRAYLMRLQDVAFVLLGRDLCSHAVSPEVLLDRAELLLKRCDPLSHLMRRQMRRWHADRLAAVPADEIVRSIIVLEATPMRLRDIRILAEQVNGTEHIHARQHVHHLQLPAAEHGVAAQCHSKLLIFLLQLCL
mmetsp:Transcript_5802/g.22648  ORF Transcript_5802/g.22648 Transcript_5802/m.22648 type:complete len:209 (-) Transcript_5802:218-844(-)